MDEPYVIHLRCSRCVDIVRSLTVYVGDEAPPTCPRCHKPMREPAHGLHNLVAE